MRCIVECSSNQRESIMPTKEQFAKFIADTGVTMTSKHAGQTREDRGTLRDDWRVRLECQGRQMRLKYSQGSGWNGKPPILSDVLECLASDAATIENSNGFEDWASDLGFDTDSRKAETSYKQCQKQTDDLRRLFDTHFDRLLWELDEDNSWLPTHTYRDRNGNAWVFMGVNAIDDTQLDFIRPFSGEYKTLSVKLATEEYTYVGEDAEHYAQAKEYKAV